MGDPASARFYISTSEYLNIGLSVKSAMTEISYQKLQRVPAWGLASEAMCYIYSPTDEFDVRKVNLLLDGRVCRWVFEARDRVMVMRP